MATSMASTEAGLKERFFRHFQDEVKTLHAQVDSLKNTSASGGEHNEAVDDCLAGIDRLSHEVKDASSYIPAYDQRTYSQAIKALSESLQSVKNSFNPPKKFAFKSRKPTAATTVPDTPPPAQPETARLPQSSPSPSNDTPTSPPPQHNQPPNTTTITNGTGIRRPSFPPTSPITISHLSNLHIALPPSNPHACTSATLSNLTHCIIDLSTAAAPRTTTSTTPTTPFATLYLKNISHSLLLCGPVAGAIHATNMTDSVLVAACRQFRMHASRDVHVYLHAGSRPIFEDCDGLGFAPLPACYVTDGIAGVENQWDQIDDFRWLKGGPSPNFRVLGEEERIKEEVWRRVAAAEDGELDELLRMVGR